MVVENYCFCFIYTRAYFNCVSGGTLHYVLIYSVHHQRYTQCVWNKPNQKHSTQMLYGQIKSRKKGWKVTTHAHVQSIIYKASKIQCVL